MCACVCVCVCVGGGGGRRGGSRRFIVCKEWDDIEFSTTFLATPS